MTFNEELLQQFKNVVANNEIFDCEGNDISDAIIVFLEQALIDKEKEVLARVCKVLGSRLDGFDFDDGEQLYKYLNT